MSRRVISTDRSRLTGTCKCKRLRLNACPAGTAQNAAKLQRCRIGHGAITAGPSLEFAPTQPLSGQGLARAEHVSSPCHLKRSMRISRTTLTYLLKSESL